MTTLTAPRRAALCLVGAAFLAAACSKPETPPAGKPKVSAAAAPSVPSPAPDANSPEANEALKERLARQAAAERLFEKKNETAVLAPPPPKSAIQAPAPEPAKAVVATPPVAETRAAPAPAPVAETRPAAPPPVPTPVVAETRPAPAAAPKVASAAPVEATKAAPAKPAAPAIPRLVSRVEPDFPAEAARSGIDRGTVRARMTLDGAGNVTRVEILEATPRRVFDRSVTKALSQWRYTEGDANRVVDSEIAFRR